MMVELTAAFTSLKAASELAQALVGLRDATMIEAKVFELQREILSAQSSALAAQRAQSLLLEHVRGLEKEIADLKAWDTEQEKYELKKVGRGALAYALKDRADTSEPEHFLCPNCYEDRRKSILQPVTLQYGQIDLLRCLSCKANINLTGIDRTLPRPAAGRVRRR